MLNKTFSHLTSTRLKELEEQNNWQIIDLSHNSIEFIDAPELLANQTALETLLLDYNVKFGARGEGKMFEHRRLLRMSCRGCGFAEIRVHNFAGFDSLVELVLAANQIKRIDGDAFRENHYLRSVDLSGNQLQVLQVSTFASLRMFEDLNLNANPLELQNNKHFIKCDSLKVLSLENCKLSKIYPQTFTEVRNLVQLRLSSNKIDDIPVAAFKLNANLKSIFIEDNQLKFFPASILDYLHLDELCVDSNPFANKNEFHTFLAKYKVENLRTQNCKSDVQTMIEYLFKNDEDSEEEAVEAIEPEVSDDKKTAQLNFHEGISDFFIGSYLSAILVVQAIGFVLLTLYLIKITKYEKLGSGADVNLANTILNDNDIYKVFKLND
jgi:Leucine-rich repeat (LRR) protein